MASSSSTKVSLKLLIDTKNEKVLFAEASKAVIDFLFNTLRLPYGNVVRLLSRNNMEGSIGNLYHSVENLSENRMQPDPLQNKDVFFNPGASTSSTQIYGLPPINELKDNNVPYLVMDDLVIQPMSAISVIMLLNKLDSKEVGTLQQKEVELGLEEVIDLLKISLQSKMVLTSVFIKKELDGSSSTYKMSKRLKSMAICIE